MSDETQSSIRPHRGVFVFTFGILSFIGGLFAIIFGPIAWISGRRDLKAMDAGVMDHEGRALTQTGYLLGMIMTLFWTLLLILGLVGLGIVLMVGTYSTSHFYEDDYGYETSDEAYGSGYDSYYDDDASSVMDMSGEDEMGMVEEAPMELESFEGFDDSTPLGSALRKATELHAEGMGNGFNPEYDKFVQSGDILLGLVETYGKAELENYPVELQTFLYNAACAYSLDGNVEKALTAYKLSVEFGWADFAHTAQDSDLENLRESDAYQQYQGQLALLALAKARAWAESELEKGASFAFDVELTSVSDAPVKLSDHAGKVVIVDFWGTWCPPCRAEVPSFIRLQNRYGEKGFQMIGLNYEGDNSEADAEKVRDFIKSENINYPCALGDDATQQQVPELDSYPTTLFIDKSGKVRLKLVGLHSYERLAAVVETLMAE